MQSEKKTKKKDNWTGTKIIKRLKNRLKKRKKDKTDSGLRQMTGNEKNWTETDKMWKKNKKIEKNKRTDWGLRQNIWQKKGKEGKKTKYDKNIFKKGNRENRL